MKGNMSNKNEIRDLLAQFHDSRADNAMPLGIDMIEQMRGKNGGYPRFMYKDGVNAEMVTNKGQEQALAQLGYRRNYSHQAYPATLYRRNMTMVKQRIGDSKEFEDVPKFPDHLETIIARDEDHELALKTARTPKDCTEWVSNVSEVPEVDYGPTQSPEATIAQLRGQIEALQAKGAALPMPEGAMSKQERQANRK